MVAKLIERHACKVYSWCSKREAYVYFVVAIWLLYNNFLLANEEPPKKFQCIFSCYIMFENWGFEWPKRRYTMVPTWLLPIAKYSYNTTFIPSILHFFTIKLCTTLVSLKAHVTPNRVHNGFFLARLQKWPWHYQMIFHIRFCIRLTCRGTPIEHGFKCTWLHTINYYPDLSSGPVNMLIRPTKYANSAKP